MSFGVAEARRRTGERRQRRSGGNDVDDDGTVIEDCSDACALLVALGLGATLQQQLGDDDAEVEVDAARWERARFIILCALEKGGENAKAKI